MDHGDLLRECRYLLHSISSQTSILVAGLQRLEGHQRHPQSPVFAVVPIGHPAVPPVPVVPEVPPPLPPPTAPAPTSPKASSVRPAFTSMPITPVATSTNRVESADLIEPVSDSASRERHRRRRSRRRDAHRHRSRSRSHRRRPLDIVTPCQNTPQQSKLCRRVDHPDSHMAVEARRVVKGPTSSDSAVMHACLSCCC